MATQVPLGPKPNPIFLSLRFENKIVLDSVSRVAKIIGVVDQHLKSEVVYGNWEYFDVLGAAEDHGDVY